MEDDLRIPRERFQYAKRGWEDRFNAAREDARMVYGDQWNQEVRSGRENAGRPALQFNVIAQDVNRAANQTRQNRPQIKISAGDKQASDDAAQFLEDKIRHIQYASEASVAYETAEEQALAQSFGFVRLTNDYMDAGTADDQDPSAAMFNQEPRIKRIRDAFTIYYDPDCEEADYSDARFCFVRKRYNRKEFKKEFKRDPVEFDTADSEMHGSDGWGNDDENVWIAEYWEVEKSKRILAQMEDGTVIWKDQIPEGDDRKVAMERDFEQSEVYMSLIDGRGYLEDRKLQETDRWIPIFIVMGKEAVVDGKVVFKSMTRDARDPQTFYNGVKSGIAENIAVTSRPFYSGPKGTFKAESWREPRLNVPYREWDPVTDKNGQLLPPPVLERPEAPIQALAQAALMGRDDIRAACGYFDATLQPSKVANLSALAVERRTDQTDLTNFHFEDNLARMQWHLGRALVHKLLKTIDTPRTLKGQKENGETYSKHIAVRDESGNPQLVPGHENEDHIVLDGRYDVVVKTGPGFDTKLDEETEGLMEAMQADPQLWQIYADILFKLKGWPELEERAKLVLPPPIQQAQAAQKQGIPPAATAQIGQLNMQNQQLKQVVAKLIQTLQTKEVEGRNKLDVQKLKNMGEIMVQDMKHRHEATMETTGHHMDAVAQMLSMLHESELGATPGPGMGNNALPEPAEPAGGATQ